MEMRFRAKAADILNPDGSEVFKIDPVDRCISVAVIPAFAGSKKPIAGLPYARE